MLWHTFAVRVLSLTVLSQLLMYAYVLVGKLFGKTPLIKLSPKKTVEGFVGAFICTLLFGIAVSLRYCFQAWQCIYHDVQWGTFWMRYPYMICPARDLGTNVFSQVTCRPNPVFMWHSFEFTGVARQALQTIVSVILPLRFFSGHCSFF